MTMSVMSMVLYVCDNIKTTAALDADTVAVAFNQSFSRCCCCKQLN